MEQQLIYEAMASVMRDVDAVAKDKNNQQQGFRYRGIDDVYNALNRVMAKHGVFTTSTVLERFREERTTAKGGLLLYTILRMRYSFWAKDGSHVDSEVNGEGMDSGDKSSNKAMAVAHKYALLQAFCIPTQETDDPDAHVYEVAHRTAPPSAPQPVKPAVRTVQEKPADPPDIHPVIQQMYGRMATKDGWVQVFSDLRDELITLLGDQQAGNLQYQHVLGLHGADNALAFKRRSAAQKCVLALWNKCREIEAAQDGTIEIADEDIPA